MIKQSTALQDEDIPVGDRINMAYSAVPLHMAGDGNCCETGMSTQMGAIAQMIKMGRGEDPLQKQLESWARFWE